MNPCFPEWNIASEFPVPTRKNKPLGLDRELVELLWENGQVVLHNQTHHPKPGPEQQIHSRQINKRHDDSQYITRGNGGSCENPVTSLIQDTETVSWIDCHVDDPFEKEFSSNFLSEFQLSNPVEGLEESDQRIRQFQDYKFSNIGVSEVNNCSNLDSNPSLPPRFHTFDSPQQHNSHLGENSKIAHEAVFRSSNKECSNRTVGEVREYSVKTVGSSHCGSNQVVNDTDTSRVSSCRVGDRDLSAAVTKEHMGKISSQSESDRVQTETLETAITSSSSGGSGTSFGRTCNHSTGTDSHKRKSRDAEDSECQSKAVELGSAARKKPALKSGSSRKSRAASVHNQSERRRRDRINEKMKALQELLPHSNKTDKASMLDEAIEYMKSLQLQLQMMWMGSGMAPIMFPAVQHYMSRLGMGIGPLAMPTVHNPMHLSRLPLIDQATIPKQAAVCPTTMLNPINYHSHFQNAKFPEQFANYMSFHPLQSASQHMNVFSFGSNTTQHNHMLSPSGHGNGGPSVG